MKILVNGSPEQTEYAKLSDLKNNRFPDSDLCFIDGHPAGGDEALTEGCRVYFAKANGSDITSLITARIPEDIVRKMRKAVVGIAGAGGLGSNIATYLARSGIGRLIVADFDRVEFSNLNRQNYALIHLGMYKVDALKEVIGEINPETEVEVHRVTLDPSNIPAIFEGCDVVCEAFDDPVSKAMLLECVSCDMPGIPLVCGSGMAGIGDTSDMTVRQLSEDIFVCGDGRSGTDSAEGILSPRVNVCAGIMANKTLQLLVSKKAKHV